MEGEDHERKKQKMEEVPEPEKKMDKEVDEEKTATSPDEKNEEDMKHFEGKSEATKRQTPFYCKTCSGEPSLCPVPCFELYHTRLIYKTVPELETQGEPPE